MALNKNDHASTGKLAGSTGYNWDSDISKTTNGSTEFTVSSTVHRWKYTEQSVSLRQFKFSQKSYSW